MNMPISVFVKTNDVEYTLKLDRKITIITGHSGTGKTTLSTAILNKNNGEPYEERVSNPMYSMSCIIGSDWKETLAGIIQSAKQGKRRIVVFDDSDIIFPENLQTSLKKTSGIYMF